MPSRSLLTVPLAAHSKLRKRHSADARLSGSTCAPGLSRDDPIVLSSDDDDDDKDYNDHKTTRARSDSGEQLPPQQPKTPVRPGVHRLPSTDPGPLRTGQKVSDTRARSYQEGDKLPCGKKQFVYAMGKPSRKHKINCTNCQKHNEEVQEVNEKETEQSRRLEESPTQRKFNDGGSGSGSSKFSNSNADVNVKETHRMDAHNRDLVASMVHHRLIQEAKARPTKGEKEGYLYILRSPHKPGLLKLGCSTRDVSKRGKEQKCVADITWVQTGLFVSHMKRAEKLAHLDLDHLRRSWNCPKCSQTHGEWFEVDEERAKEVTERWTKWINQQTPYEMNKQTPNDMHWQLKPMWAWLMDEQRAPLATFEDSDHQARWIHWEKVLAPPTSKTERAWTAYLDRRGFKTVTQQKESKETRIPYRQPTLNNQKDGVVRTSQNFAEQIQAVAKAFDIRQTGSTNNITIKFKFNIQPYPQGSQRKVTELE
jgi:hypothetical protein